MFKQYLLPTALLLLMTGACQQDFSGKKAAPDVSNLDVPFQLLRFDQDIFALDTANLAEEMSQLSDKYPDLLPLFTETLIRDQTNPSETPQQALKSFLAAPFTRGLYDSVQLKYSDLRWLEPQLHNMLRYYRYYFPDRPTPAIATVISEFGVDAFTYGDSLCGIGLDMFLGAESAYYDVPEIFPVYLRRNFTEQHIPVRLARAIAQHVVGPPPSGGRLIDYMLHNGKVLHIASSLLPAVPDSLIMGYTREQLSGCVANEAQVWARLLDQNLVYQADYNKFRKLIEPSPNAPIVFTEAPGEIGNWVGWQIVRSYMQRHPETTMSALTQHTEAQKFLEESRYKPRK
jgi:hypothetical protein